MIDAGKTLSSIFFTVFTVGITNDWCMSVWGGHDIFLIYVSFRFILTRPGAGRQWLRTGGGLVGTRRGHVWDDVWSVALLQPGPRAPLWVNPHGGDSLPQEPGSRGESPSSWSAQEGPQTKVCPSQPMCSAVFIQHNNLDLYFFTLLWHTLFYLMSIRTHHRLFICCLFLR